MENVTGYHIYDKCDTQTGFNRFRIINTLKSEFHNKAMRTMRDVVMLLLLQRPLKDARMFSTFKKLEELTTSENRRWEQRSVSERYKLV
jgi:hypothetical protein